MTTKQMRMGFTWRLPVVFGLFFALTAPAQAQAQVGNARSPAAVFEGDMSLIETELNGVERRVSSLRADVSAGSLTRSPRIINERFTEAKYAYLVEDYDRCALLLYSLLENRDLELNPRRPEAQWYLAECLFQDGNLEVARKQFQGIVDTGGIHPFYGDSLLKLIEIFGRTGDTDRFNEYYNRFVRSSMDSSPTSLRIRYEMGKSLYRQGKLRDSMSIFGGFPRGSTYTPQARYFSGVILVAEGQSLREDGDLPGAEQRFQQAIVVFREVLTLPASTPEHAQVRDLCVLAVGRLRYEMGDIPAAIEEYSKIDLDSDYYADALYEMIWANIEAASQLELADQAVTVGETAVFERTRKFQEALRAIEIFNLAFPNDARLPTLRLLGGHVRVRMEKFDEAVERYSDASEHFRALKDVVDEVVASGTDPMVYFNQLVGEEYLVEAALTIPVSARRQARSDERVASAVAVSRDLYRQQDDIEDAADVLDLLEEALYQKDSAGLIQTYRINRQQLASAEAAGLLLRSRLIDVEANLLESLLPAGAVAELRVLLAEEQTALEAASSLSSQRQEALQRQGVFNLQAQAVETRVYHVELAVKDLLGRLSALEEYLVDARQRGEKERDEELEARDTIEEERSRLTELRTGLHELKKRLEPRVLTAPMASLVVSDESGRGSLARSGLGRLERKLTELRRQASGSADLFARLDGARNRLVALEQVATTTRELMDRAEFLEVDEIKKEVAYQRREVSSLDAQGNRIEQANQRVSGRIGEQAFVDVAAFYEDMLTRADMGIADVYWYRKESTAKSRVALSREKVRRLKALQEAFAEVLGQ
ncbi:MAG: tetratricopeptide repeat protein [Myxococcota bacterium]|nr:tetratricopeptide repeat protein [Myxococcota bacterium]